ncbi:LysR family transcriptional regulator [Nitratidesulfovibrio sp. HK-II]|uniref:LysR family transcriptional regulator n=1 Tax=Nitratidesulfovibrio sp. HK-II TaxID=2009266 RepID=UPI000E2F7937|nr:LysR family regulatory protein CidR [Nitratidesulfovibrio sp. HK-II]
MHLRVLRSFVEVVRAGGFSAAAQAVCATQSTVSKAVRGLEEDCGAILLERTPAGVTLTAAGEVTYRRALAMLAEKEAMDAELDDLRNVRRGTLRFGVPPVGSTLLFARQFAQYRRRYPGVRIELREKGCYALEEDVLRGELEMALALLPVSGQFEVSPLCDEPLMALLPQGHPLQGREALCLHDLDGSAFIQFEQGFALNARIRDRCLKQGVRLDETLCSGQIPFIISLVAAGLGVALVPRLMLTEPLPDGVHRALLDDDELRWRAVLAWRKGHSLSPAAAAWLELMHEMPPRISCGRDGGQALMATPDRPSKQDRPDRQVGPGTEGMACCGTAEVTGGRTTSKKVPPAGAGQCCAAGRKDGKNGRKR